MPFYLIKDKTNKQVISRLFLSFLLLVVLTKQVLRRTSAGSTSIMPVSKLEYNRNDGINVHNTAFFSTCDDKYIPFSMTALLSIRTYLPEAMLFLLCRSPSAKNMQLLQANNIDCIICDFDDRFIQLGSYPSECYYLFAGPQLFKKMGYRFSVYLDGDILCLSNPLRNFPKALPGYAGVGVDSLADIVGMKELRELTSLYNLSESAIHTPRIQSGVVFFNNTEMESINLIDLATSVFQTCLKAKVPRKGDDSLFALIQLLLPSYYQVYLPCSYNHITSTQIIHNTSEIQFLHFTHRKPWELTTRNPPIQYTDMYLRILKKHCPDIFYRRSIRGRIVQTIRRTLSDTLSVVLGLRYSSIRRWYNSKQTIDLYLSIKDVEKQQFNFGDALSEYLIPQLFGFKVRLTSVDKCQLAAIGSIIRDLERFNSPDHKIIVWGSGFIQPYNNCDFSDINFKAVRGLLTAKRLKQKVTVYGDPGLLVPVVYQRCENVHERIGVVVHYIDLDLPIVQSLRSDKRFIVINPLTAANRVCCEISRCRLILSSSLHGLIVADSYSIPNIRLKLSDKVIGDEYKFRDYCSGVGRQFTQLDFSKLETGINLSKLLPDKLLEQIISDYHPISNLRSIQARLVAAFPTARQLSRVKAHNSG